MKNCVNPLSVNLRMVKHTQTIRRLLLTNYLSVFDHFMRLALKGLRLIDYEVNKVIIELLMFDRIFTVILTASYISDNVQ